MAHHGSAVDDELNKSKKRAQKLAASGKSAQDRFRAHLATLTTPELLAVADAVTREASRRVQKVNAWAASQVAGRAA